MGRRLERVTALVPLLLTDRRSTPAARADRQEPLPMFRCPGLPGFPSSPDHHLLTYLVNKVLTSPPPPGVRWRYKPGRHNRTSTNILKVIRNALYPREHTQPPRPSTCSACRATAQVSSLGSRQLMAGLAGHVARAFRRCSWSPTGHFSGGAHTQLFRKAGDPPLSRRHGRFPPRP